jgi:hypothetical protein
MTDARYHLNIDGTEFVWHGGAYIDVGSTQAMGSPGINGDDFHAYDCINVWDYATDEPTIERSLEAFEQRCREYVEDMSEAS